MVGRLIYRPKMGCKISIDKKYANYCIIRPRNRYEVKEEVNMGVYEIACPMCSQRHMWFSGNMDQRCPACQTASYHIEAVSAITKPRGRHG